VLPWVDLPVVVSRGAAKESFSAPRLATREPKPRAALASSLALGYILSPLRGWNSIHHVYFVAMRVLALALVICWVLIPQLGCFLPINEMTQTESECCQQMAGDCGEANMQGHACCTGIVRPDAATATQAHREFVPHSELTSTPQVSGTLDLGGLVAAAALLAQRDIHAPPDDPHVSSLILRI